MTSPRPLFQFPRIVNTDITKTKELSISRDTTVQRQRELAKGHDATVDQSTQRIQEKNESVIYDQELNNFRIDIGNTLKTLDIVFNNPVKGDKFIPGAFSLAGTLIPGNFSLLNANTLTALNPLAQLNKAAKAESEEIRVPARVIQKTINKPLKKEMQTLIIQQLSKYPRLFGGRTVANAVPLIGDVIAGALVAAEEYAETNNIAEAMVVGSQYVIISKTAGASAAAICGSSAAAAGTVIPVAGNIVGGISGATVCDAAASVIAGEIYYATIRKKVREISTDIETQFAASRQTSNQTNSQVAISQPIQALPAVIIMGKPQSSQLATNNINPIDAKLAGRRDVTKQANRVSAERTKITRTTVTKSAEVYTYPVVTQAEPVSTPVRYALSTTQLTP